MSRLYRSLFAFVDGQQTLRSGLGPFADDRGDAAIHMEDQPGNEGRGVVGKGV